MKVCGIPKIAVPVEKGILQFDKMKRAVDSKLAMPNGITNQPGCAKWQLVYLSSTKNYRK